MFAGSVSLVAAMGFVAGTAVAGVLAGFVTGRMVAPRRDELVPLPELPDWTPVDFNTLRFGPRPAQPQQLEPVPDLEAAEDEARAWLDQAEADSLWAALQREYELGLAAVDGFDQIRVGAA